MELGGAIGAVIKSARGSKSQDEFAQIARACGLDWNRNVVANLEAGRREVTAGEMLLLPHALSLVLGQTVELTDLFPGGGSIEVTSTAALPRSAVRAILSGRSGEAKLPRISSPEKGPSTALADARRWAPIVQRLWPEMTGADELAQKRPAEEKAARAIGVPLMVIVAASQHCFGRGLTEERERRLRRQRLEPSTKSAAASARRAITHKLLEQIREAVVAAGGTIPRRRGTR